MLPAQIANVAEASLGPLPPSNEFLDALRLANAPRPPPPDTALFGNTFAIAPRPPPGTERNAKQATKAAFDFESA